MALRDFRLKRRDRTAALSSLPAGSPTDYRAKRIGPVYLGKWMRARSPPRATSRDGCRRRGCAPCRARSSARARRRRSPGCAIHRGERTGETRARVPAREYRDRHRRPRYRRRHRPARRTPRRASHNGAHWRSDCQGSAAAHSAAPAGSILAPGTTISCVPSRRAAAAISSISGPISVSTGISVPPPRAKSR